MKICTKCKVSKDTNNDSFRTCIYPNGTTYLKSRCRDCEREVALDHAAKNRDKCKESTRNFLNNNPEYTKIWNANNRVRLRNKERDRYHTDVCFRLRKNVSRAINHSLHKQQARKANSITKDLPYSIYELKEHLEKQFAGEMNWLNYGSFWHIDHIVPQSDLPFTSFFEENFILCWRLSNLRPLDAKQNCSDGATRIRHK